MRGRTSPVELLRSLTLVPAIMLGIALPIALPQDTNPLSGNYPVRCFAAPPYTKLTAFCATGNGAMEWRGRANFTGT